MKWTQSKEVRQGEWHLLVPHHDPTAELLSPSATDKDTNFEPLAKAAGAAHQLAGEDMFRAGRIGRLVFNNRGVTKHGSCGS